LIKLKFPPKKAYFEYCIAGMQNKSLFYWIFSILGQYLCPKNTFRLIYIGVKTLEKSSNYDRKNA